MVRSVEVVLEDESHVAGRALQRRRAERADRVEAVGTVRDVHARPVPAHKRLFTTPCIFKVL